jgi:hypothetical protein
MSDIGIWITALATLAIYSFLYRDNPFYKAAEYLLIGLTVGYSLVISVKTVLWPGLVLPLLGGDTAKIIPLVLGGLMFIRLVPKLGGWSRIPLAVYVGAGAGVSIPAMLKARVLQQMGATMSNVTTISGVIMLVGVITTILYFYFSREQKGLLQPVAKIGTYYMMIFFGATFGYTVMSRVSLLIGRMEFLLGDWLRLIAR